MRTYQTHKVTVESQAISVTADFVIDLYETFRKVDQHVISLIENTDIVDFKYDGYSLFGITHSEYGTPEDHIIIDNWNFLYRTLHTVHTNVPSGVYDYWLNMVKAEHEKIEP